MATVKVPQEKIKTFRLCFTAKLLWWKEESFILFWKFKADSWHTGAGFNCGQHYSTLHYVVERSGGRKMSQVGIRSKTEYVAEIMPWSQDTFSGKWHRKGMWEVQKEEDWGDALSLYIRYVAFYCFCRFWLFLHISIYLSISVLSPLLLFC